MTWWVRATSGATWLLFALRTSPCGRLRLCHFLNHSFYSCPQTSVIHSFNKHTASQDECCGRHGLKHSAAWIVHLLWVRHCARHCLAQGEGISANSPHPLHPRGLVQSGKRKPPRCTDAFASPSPSPIRPPLPSPIPTLCSADHS